MTYKTTFIANTFTYQDYRMLIDDLLAQGKTTGPDQSVAMINYTKINVQRMKRLDKTVIIQESILNAVQQLKQNYTWLVLTEAWCGDAAQILPTLHKIGENSNGKISVRYMLRDQNIDIMDAHLTYGGRAVPKLIVLDHNLTETTNWGPRPKLLQDLFLEWKTEPNTTKADWSEKIHSWYAKDKTVEIQKELLAILQSIN
jgi:hypothetical protein